MIKSLMLYLSGLVLGLVLLIFGHQWWFDSMSFSYSHEVMRLCYSVNALMAVFIVFLIYLLRNKFRDELGFLFLFGSLFKFLIYFVFFKSLLGDARLDFTIFFFPYLFSLLFEVFCLVKILKSDG
ncbi:MAG: hypothetical protein ACPGRE_05415 [Flavobacteriaceae bacterium]